MSKEKKEQLESIYRRYWPVLTLTIIAVALIVGGFLVPPFGAIDGSVLTASGEIFAFAALLVFVIRAEAGDDVIIRKGDLEVQVKNDEPKVEDQPLLEQEPNDDNETQEE